METQISVAHPQGSIALRRGLEFAFLTISQVMLRLLVCVGCYI